jgi:lipopolysaccharide transport system ATP-binding protein
MTAAVDVQHVSKSFRVYRDRNQSLKATLLTGKRAVYDRFQALDDVTFEVPEGSTFGLLGRNGSGKSTLLKCMARILNPNSGTITTRGRIAAMLEVGSGFHPELSGRENVYLNGSILGMSRAEIDNKFDQIVDFSGVERFIDQPVKNYSSGMYVRLGFAVSIHVEPDVLLVDEVLAVGDMDFQEKCMAKFAQFRREGRTVVVVSHGLEQMRNFCDHAAWLDQGVLQDVGVASAIVDQYADSGHAATAGPGGGMRFGSGELQFTQLALVDHRGDAVSEARAGEPATIRLWYESKERIERPVIAASLHTVEGAHLWELNSRDAGFAPAAIDAGHGTVDVRVDRLPLAPGGYSISATAQDDSMTHMFDSLQHGGSFTVLGGAYRTSGGMLALDATIENLQQH